MTVKGAKELWERYKYMALAALAGLILLALPSGERTKAQTPPSRDLEREIEEIISSIQGVGQVKVLLTEDTDGELQLARDTEVKNEAYSSSAVLLDGGEGDEPLVVQTVYPAYRGALVVCSGGDDPAVKLTVIQAVAALTGLSRDRITVAKWQ